MFDWAHPDYVPIFQKRVDRLMRIRADPSCVPHLKAYYKEHTVDFIRDWGVTLDPRNVEVGLPALIPFLLFEKQVDWVHWLIDRWQARERGLSEKSRDMGLSWLAIATSCTLCLHYDGMAIGFGSRKEEYVDKIGDPKSLFYKARVFMANLPREFRGGWSITKHAPHMRLIFPETESNLSGEAGDNIGRGDRKGIYFVDEAAHLEHPELVEASLSQTTNCRQDISTPNGRANAFAIRRFSGKTPVFTFRWQDDPRKNVPETIKINGEDVVIYPWYEKQRLELDPVTLAQEVDLDYSASVEGVVIPALWVTAALDAHIKLGIEPTGRRSGALDVADEGKDLNAFAAAHGVVLTALHEWTGKGSDIMATTQKAFDFCEDGNLEEFLYDADGLGAGVRGDARVINEKRKMSSLPHINVKAFRGSGAVERPEGQDVRGRLNKDYFGNLKAQSWWSLRIRFQSTYRWVVQGVPCKVDDIISIPSKLAHRDKLISELSQPTYTINAIGKMYIDKAPEGAPSPNLGDAVMMKFSSVRRGLRISDEALAKA